MSHGILSAERCQQCDYGLRSHLVYIQTVMMMKRILVCSMIIINHLTFVGLHNHHYMLRLASPASEWTGCGRRGGGGRHGAWWWPGGAQPAWGGWGGPQSMRRMWRQFMRNQAGQGKGECSSCIILL